jgi:hypothetical protein
MAGSCSICGAKLGFGRRLAGKTLCKLHEAEQRASEQAAAIARENAMNEYVAIAATVATDTSAVERLHEIARDGYLLPSEIAEAKLAALSGLMRQAIEDAHLTEAEEQAIARAAFDLDVPPDQIAASIQEFVPPASNLMLIAQVNAGRLPTLQDPPIVLKRGEVAHLNLGAVLLKEVAHRETRGGFSGFSFPLAAGIRYRVGAYKGKSVVVGTSIEEADNGVLCITSKRAVFIGLRQSIECLHAKLLGLNVFDDGIQLHVSNRKTPTLLRLSDGHLAAAAINAAAKQ